MMNAATGRLMPLADHLAQSVRNILFTRIGTRVQREEYGSLLPLLIDMPLNEITLLRCASATVMALAAWEPRFTVTAAAVTPLADGSGRVRIAIEGELNGRAETFVVNM
jgi:hypothetical protein